MSFTNTEVSFFGVSDIGAGYDIKFTRLSDTHEITIPWRCVATRTAAFQYSQGVDISSIAVNALSAASADISNDPILSPVFNVETFPDGFRIIATEYGWDTLVTVQAGASRTLIDSYAEVPPLKDFQLTGYSLSESAAPCSSIDLTITQADGVAPYTWITPSNASTTLTATIARQATNQDISVTLQDSELDQATLPNVIIPKLFTSADITNISVVTNTGGLDATVTIFMTDEPLFTYTYSLDGSIFQSSNVFPNVTDGTYTVYVADGFGCISSQGFTVDTATSVHRASAYFTLPKSNPFRWVQRSVNKYQTLDNTLYRNWYVLGQFKPDWQQPYQTNDGVITNQFRSNYDELSARILDCNDNIIDTLTIVKKSDNIGSQDKRDCIAFNRGSNQTGLYFTSGNIYDPVTGDDIGDYELNGNLPDWGKVGNTVILSGSIVGSFVIKQVLFDSSVQANALIIDSSWTSGNDSESIISECTYNRQNYEVYEFDFDTADYVGIEGTYRAEILMSDSLDEYPILAFDSEYINIKASHERTNFIDYSESDSSGIDYSTGFIGRVRVESLTPYAQMNPGGEFDQYNDSRDEIVTLKANATLPALFYIEVVPYGYVEKFNLIFKHFNVNVNGEKWSATEYNSTVLDTMSALNSVEVSMQRNNYEEYQTDNIDVDGDKGTIDQEEGSILQ